MTEQLQLTGHLPPDPSLEPEPHRRHQGALTAPHAHVRLPR